MESGSLPPVDARVLVSYEKQEVWGVVKFAGTTSFAEGTWVGVALDTPVGKNNGTVKGEQYFECASSHGVFVRPKSILKSEPAAIAKASISPRAAKSGATAVTAPAPKKAPSKAAPGTQLLAPSKGAAKKAAAKPAAVALVALPGSPDEQSCQTPREAPMGPVASNTSEATTAVPRSSGSSSQSAATIQQVLVLNREIKALRSIQEEATKANEAIEARLRQHEEKDLEAVGEALKEELQQLRSQQEEQVAEWTKASSDVAANAQSAAELVQAQQTRLEELEKEVRERSSSGLPGPAVSEEQVESFRRELARVQEQLTRQQQDSEALRMEIAQDRNAKAAQDEKIIELEKRLFEQGLQPSHIGKLEVLASQVQANVDVLMRQNDRIRTIEVHMQSLLANDEQLRAEQVSNRALRAEVGQLMDEVRSLRRAVSSLQQGSPREHEAPDSGWFGWLGGGLSCAARPGRPTVMVDSSPSRSSKIDIDGAADKVERVSEFLAGGSDDDNDAPKVIWEGGEKSGTGEA